ncbi:MAG: hypothetical protein KDB22_12065 [Planctomycetales bacterium]|nr:hypothetical protein [Planctomycetales bacterium]
MCDDAHSSKSDQLDHQLRQQCELLLESLTQQANLARVEAKRAQLELLMAQAQRGDAQPLRRWVRENAPLQFEADQQRVRDWSILRIHAQERLLQLSTTSQVRALAAADSLGKTHSSAKEPRPSESLARRSPQGKIRRARPEKKPVNELSAKEKRSVPDNESESGSSAATDKLQGRAGQRRQSAADRATPIVLNGKSVNIDPSDQGDEIASPHRTKWRLRGALISILAHVLLLIALAVITLKLPAKPAGMALQSTVAETNDEIFELTSDQPVATPDMTEALEQTLETASDVSEQFDALEMPSDSLDSIAPAASFAQAAASAASASSALSASRLASASFFGAAANGNCFCYVIDGSLSMRGGAWEAAKAELIKSLNSLKPKQRFYVIFFNRQLEAIPAPGEMTPAAGALYATAENLQHANRWLDTLEIDIGAPPIDALEKAIALEPDAIYLLTDGDTTVDVTGILRKENRVADLLGVAQIRTPIHTIAFYSLAGQTLLRQIAAENQGQFVYVPDPRKKR